MIVAENISKRYSIGDSTLEVLRDVSLKIEQGEFIAIVGPSGSGKTTLLGLLAGLDTPSSGSISFDGTKITSMTEDQRAKLRGEKVGFIFQNFQLIPTLTATENVRVPLDLQPKQKLSSQELDEFAIGLLSNVGLKHRVHHYPLQMSGGEQQRVAVARAFSNNPSILFADEPTGNLDSTNGEAVIDIISRYNKESGTTIVLVTHDLHLAASADRIIEISDGKIVRDNQKTIKTV